MRRLTVPKGNSSSASASPARGIAHKTTQVRRPQSNGIVERLHRTLLDEHVRVEGRRTWFETVDEMQAALDVYLQTYSRDRPHQGRGMNGRTPHQAFVDGLPLQRERRMTEPEADDIMAA